MWSYNSLLTDASPFSAAEVTPKPLQNPNAKRIPSKLSKCNDKRIRKITTPTTSKPIETATKYKKSAETEPRLFIPRHRARAAG